MEKMRQSNEGKKLALCYARTSSAEHNYSLSLTEIRNRLQSSAFPEGTTLWRDNPSSSGY